MTVIDLQAQLADEPALNTALKYIEPSELSLSAEFFPPADVKEGE